jgi:hypothetical protein
MPCRTVLNLSNVLPKYSRLCFSGKVIKSGRNVVSLDRWFRPQIHNRSLKWAEVGIWWGSPEPYVEEINYIFHSQSLSDAVVRPKSVI